MWGEGVYLYIVREFVREWKGVVVLGLGLGGGCFYFYFILQMGEILCERGVGVYTFRKV